MEMGTLLYWIKQIRDDPDAAVVLVGAHGIVERALTSSNIGAMFSTFDTAPTRSAVSAMRYCKKAGDHSSHGRTSIGDRPSCAAGAPL